MSAGAGDERGGPETRAPETFDDDGPELEALIDEARRLDPHQLKTLIRLIRQALAEQDAP